jgi:raffinose/stachyose/melibiose transport system substrate-binding protein
MKKISSILLVLTLTMALFAGCGKSDNVNSGVDAGTTDNGQTENTGGSEDVDSASEGEITITMMYSGTAAENDFETQVLPDLVKKEFPNINLEVTKLPDDQYYTALKTKLASGEAPDIILVQPKYAGANSVIGLAEAGYLEPISDLNVLDKIGEAGTDSFMYEGEVYGVPSGVTILGTYYNKDMFDEYGIEVPTNWNQFLAACETLKENGVQPIVMGDKDMYVMQFGLYQLAANIVYPQNPNFDDDLRTGSTKYTDKGTWDKVLDMYTTLYDNGYIDTNSIGLGAQQAIQKFVDGEAAMTFDGSFNAPALTAQGAVDFERGYFPLPGNTEGEQIYASMAVGAGPAITKDSQYIEECKQILEFWRDGESELWQAYVDSGKIIPTYGYGSDNTNPMFDRFIELYNEGNSYYWCNQGWPAGVEVEMETLLSEYIGGVGTTVEDMTNGMQRKFDELTDN